MLHPIDTNIEILHPPLPAGSRIDFYPAATASQTGRAHHAFTVLVFHGEEQHQNIEWVSPNPLSTYQRGWLGAAISIARWLSQNDSADLAAAVWCPERVIYKHLPRWLNGEAPSGPLKNDDLVPLALAGWRNWRPALEDFHPIFLTPRQDRSGQAIGRHQAAKARARDLRPGTIDGA